MLSGFETAMEYFVHPASLLSSAATVRHEGMQVPS
jgi:hypothetical protein